MSVDQVDAFFQDYALAFSRRDVDHVCALWDYPAFMSYEGRQAVLDQKDFRLNTTRLCDFYERQGLRHAEKQVLELAHLTATTATVRTRDRLFNADGGLIAEWEHVYLLSETAQGIRVAAAMPDNELAAWRARGTPLGS